MVVEVKFQMTKILQTWGELQSFFSLARLPRWPYDCCPTTVVRCSRQCCHCVFATQVERSAEIARSAMMPYTQMPQKDIAELANVAILEIEDECYQDCKITIWCQMVVKVIFEMTKIRQTWWELQSFFSLARLPRWLYDCCLTTVVRCSRQCCHCVFATQVDCEICFVKWFISLCDVLVLVPVLKGWRFITWWELGGSL